MPITLTVPEGLLTVEAGQKAFAGLTDALLKSAQLSGNAFMTPNVVGTINVLPRGRVFSGGKPAPAVFIELKLPGIALATPEAKQAFIADATAIVEEASRGCIPRDHIRQLRQPHDLGAADRGRRPPRGHTRRHRAARPACLAARGIAIEEALL